MNKFKCKNCGGVVGLTDKTILKTAAQINGKKGKRVLTPVQAKAMVAIREKKKLLSKASKCYECHFYKTECPGMKSGDCHSYIKKKYGKKIKMRLDK